MNFSRLLGLAALALSPLCATSTLGAIINVSGNLTGTINWTADNTYVLNGFTYVLGGGVLNIEAGTVIQGVPGTGGPTAVNDFGCLFICRGAKINAIGTPYRPIIFTTTEDDVTDPDDLPFPTRGRWGGVVIFGNARVNNPASTTVSQNFDIYEGLPDTQASPSGDYLHRFGGNDDADSSGCMRFVSIRHGGKKLETDKEVNGLSLGGVGSGTILEYIETYCTADDGFEFFGGSVNTRYLVSAFNDDDSFDTDQGYHGKNQFWFAIQESGTRDEGGEINGQPNAPDILVTGAEPVATHEVYNATFIGGGTTGSGNDSLNIRRANSSKWYNNIFTEYQGVRVNIDGTSQPDLKNNLFWNHAAGNGASGNGTGYGTAFCPAVDNPVADPLLRGIDRSPDSILGGTLDPRLAVGSPAFTGFKTQPMDGFYAYAPYKGAFGDKNNWMQHWTALDANGFMPRPTEVHVSGNLTGTINWTSDHTYILDDFTYVLSGAVLNIEPGTVIKGVPVAGVATRFGCLFVCRGGKIQAEGTAENPIIFTTTEDDVNDPDDMPFPTRGRWGGVVLFGNARINNPAITTVVQNYDIYEGLPDVESSVGSGQYLHRFGGSDDNDSSGTLRYVSIRHGGKKLESDKEVNGLSLGGVGRGTTIEFVETFCTADDGFEFFGGSVNTKYLVSAYNDDDSFDTDQGYNGKNQFWFSIQESGTRDEGGEINGQPNAPDTLVPGAVPTATHEVMNATFIGAGNTGTGNDSLNIRRVSFSKWYNNIFTGFQGVRVNIDLSAGTPSAPDLQNNIFWDHAADAGVPGSAAGNGTGYGSSACPALVNPVINPLLGAVDRAANGLLDPVPTSASPAYSTVFRPTPSDGFYTDAPFVGAFKTQNWAQDWTAMGNTTSGGSKPFFKVTCPTSTLQVQPTFSPDVTTVDNGANATVSWPSIVGRTYKLQSTVNLTSWSDVTGWTAGTGSSLSQVVAVPGSTILFRVLVQ